MRRTSLVHEMAFSNDDVVLDTVMEFPAADEENIASSLRERK